MMFKYSAFGYILVCCTAAVAACDMEYEEQTSYESLDGAKESNKADEADSCSDWHIVRNYGPQRYSSFDWGLARGLGTCRQECSAWQNGEQAEHVTLSGPNSDGFSDCRIWTERF